MLDDKKRAAILDMVREFAPPSPSGGWSALDSEKQDAILD